MEERGVRAALEALLRLDPAVCDRRALDEVVRLSAKLRAWLDAVDVGVARRARELEAEGRSESPAGVLSGYGRRSSREARAASDRAAACEQLPSFEAALADGSVSSGHVDALATLVRGLDEAGRSELATWEDELLSSARGEPVSVFERRCRALGRRIAADEGESELERQQRAVSVRRWVDKATGMHHTHLALDPVRDQQWWTAVQAELTALQHSAEGEGRPFEQLQADAIVRSVSGSGGRRRVPQVIVLVDLETLRHGLHERSVCELVDGSPLPPSTVRRLACEADIVPVVLGGAGEVLDVGRSERLATPAQRTALGALYRTCSVDECDVPFADCQIHHVDPWEQHGSTDLDRLTPLCHTHHHLVHEGGWRLELAPDRTVTLIRPDGTVARSGITTDRRPVACCP